MAHVQKSDFVFQRKGRVHLNRRGLQFSRLLAAEVCASVVLILDTPRSEVVCRVLTTHSIPQFPFHFPSRASSCVITFQLDSTASFLAVGLEVAKVQPVAPEICGIECVQVPALFGACPGLLVCLIRSRTVQPVAQSL